MKKIRKNVFETNSSSTHSIHFNTNKKDFYETLNVSDNGILFIDGGKFGWKWKRFDDVKTKLSYALLYAVRYCFGKPEVKEMLFDLLKEHTGAKTISYPPGIEDRKSYEYYIDHESVHTLYEIFKNKNNLKEFLFNHQYELITGNDNSYEPLNFWKEKYARYNPYSFIVIIDGFGTPLYMRNNNDWEYQLEGFKDKLGFDGCEYSISKDDNGITIKKEKYNHTVNRYETIKEYKYNYHIIDLDKMRGILSEWNLKLEDIPHMNTYHDLSEFIECDENDILEFEETFKRVKELLNGFEL